MKRILRKVASIFVATAVVAAMGVTAMATTLTDGIAGDDDPADSLNSENLFIEKELLVYNPSETSINGPAITYTYSIAPGSANKVITDEKDPAVVDKTKQGPAGAVAFANGNTISWTNDTVKASQTGESNIKSIELKFTPSAFSGPGVYRYEITENITAAAYTASGVKEGDAAHVRYLDVYVRNPKDSTESGPQIYGYVLFQKDNNINAHAADTEDDAVVKAGKTSGFITTTNPNDSSETFLADQYYTYNIQISKDLVNDNFNATHKFPFALTFANSDITNNIDLIGSSTGTVEFTDPGAGAITSLELLPKIADDGVVKIVGIPCGTSVAITETNDIDAVAYRLTTDGAPGDELDELLNGGVTSTAVNVTSTKNQTADDAAIVFTNTLELISPTGVAMAVLPFVILLGFGIGFMVISTTKRKEEQA